MKQQKHDNIPERRRRAATGCAQAKAHLIVGSDLADEDGEVLDSQRGVVVDLLVGPLHCGLGVTAEGKKTKKRLTSQRDGEVVRPLRLWGRPRDWR